MQKRASSVTGLVVAVALLAWAVGAFFEGRGSSEQPSEAPPVGEAPQTIGIRELGQQPASGALEDGDGRHGRAPSGVLPRRVGPLVADVRQGTGEMEAPVARPWHSQVHGDGAAVPSRATADSQPRDVADRDGRPTAADFMGPETWMAAASPQLDEAVQRELSRPLPVNGPGPEVVLARAQAMEEVQQRAQTCHHEVYRHGIATRGRIALAADLSGAGSRARLERVSIVAQTGLDDPMFHACLLQATSQVEVPYQGLQAFELALEIPLLLP